MVAKQKADAMGNQYTQLDYTPTVRVPAQRNKIPLRGSGSSGSTSASGNKYNQGNATDRDRAQGGPDAYDLASGSAAMVIADAFLNGPVGSQLAMQADQSPYDLQVSLSLGFKGLLLCTVDFLFHVGWCIRQLCCSATILYIISNCI